MKKLEELFNELPLPGNIESIKRLLIKEKDTIERYVSILSPAARHRLLPELRKIREELQLHKQEVE